MKRKPKQHGSPCAGCGNATSAGSRASLWLAWLSVAAVLLAVAPQPAGVMDARAQDPAPAPAPVVVVDPPTPTPTPELPTLEVPPSVTVLAGRLARVPIEANVATAWQVVAGDADVFREWSPDPLDVRLCVLGYEPGSVTIAVAASSGTADAPLLRACTVTFTGPAPPPEPPIPPTPPGPPTPPSPPTPQAKSVWVVTVDAAMDRTPELTAWYSDGAYWAQLTAAGHLWYHADANNPRHAEYAKAAQSLGLPAALIVDAAPPHKLLKSLKLPAERAAMAAAVTESVTAITAEGK